MSPYFGFASTTFFNSQLVSTDWENNQVFKYFIFTSIEGCQTSSSKNPLPTECNVCRVAKDSKTGTCLPDCEEPNILTKDRYCIDRSGNCVLTFHFLCHWPCRVRRSTEQGSCLSPPFSVYAHNALWVSHVKISRSQLLWYKVVSWWQTNRSWIFTMLHSVYVWVHLSTVWTVRDLDGSWRVTNLLKSKSSNLIFDFFFVVSQTQQTLIYIVTWVNLLVPFKLVLSQDKRKMHFLYSHHLP